MNWNMVAYPSRIEIMLKQFFEKISWRPEHITIYSAGLTDVGQKRDHNEDNHLIDEHLGLFVVADGMGGHEAGEVASKLAIDTIFNRLKDFETLYKKKKEKNVANIVNTLLQEAVEEANNKTHAQNIANGQPEGRGMGTTVTGFLISALNPSKQRKLYSFNVGDSRIYSFLKGKLTQLSTDHSHYQLWLDTGKEGKAPRSNIIYKAIGPWSRIIADQQVFPIHSSEIFLLCSDGLSDMLSDEEIGHIMRTNRKNPLKQMAQSLIDAANEAGGKDNITVILVKP